MNRLCRAVGLLCLLLVVAFCSSCADRPFHDHDFGLGETLPPELTEKETENSDGETSEEETVLPEAYWLENGSVYHTHPECRHLKEKEDVQSGTVEEAFAEGKERLCSVCSKVDEQTETDAESVTDANADIDTDVDSESDTEPTDEFATETETNVPDHGVMVYWTEKGGVYHLRRDCSSLKNSANVLSGTIEESGKPRACSRCD